MVSPGEFAWQPSYHWLLGPAVTRFLISKQVGILDPEREVIAK